MAESSPAKALTWLFRGLFAIDAVLNLAGHLTGQACLAHVSKPLLMPILGAAAVCDLGVRSGPKDSGASLALRDSGANGRFGRDRNLLIGALLLYTLGDILLMNSGDGFFMGGLASFLAGHCLMLSILIPRYLKPSPKKTKRLLTAVWAVLVLTVGALFGDNALITLIFMIYGSALILLMLCSLAGILAEKGLPARLIIIGGILFIASDSMIVRPPASHSGLAVMSTYITACFLIVSGIVLSSGRGGSSR